MSNGEFSRIRVLNTIPNLGAIDVYVGPKSQKVGYKIISGINYKEISDYVQVPDGSPQIIRLRVHNRDDFTIEQLIVEKEFTFTDDITLVVYGLYQDRNYPVDILGVKDEKNCPNYNASFLRLINVSPGKVSYDFYDGEDRIFTNSVYGTLGDPKYFQVFQGETNFSVEISGTNHEVMETGPIVVTPGKVLTVVLNGIYNNPNMPLNGILFSDPTPCATSTTNTEDVPNDFLHFFQNYISQRQ